MENLKGDTMRPELEPWIALGLAFVGTLLMGVICWMYQFYLT
jgi:nitrate reductase NapE component